MSSSDVVISPVLRIIPTDAPIPHEEHDHQRAQPLVEIIRKAPLMTNPPMLAETEHGDYVVLDGANRCFAFRHCGFPHILAQIVHYDTGQVTLETWNHVISGWNAGAFLSAVEQLPGVALIQGVTSHDRVALIQLHAPEVHHTYSLVGTFASVVERNALLRQFVKLYHANARLNRTAIQNPKVVWEQFPEALALITFSGYEPKDIIEAATAHAFLPPGISRHIVQGRALQLNYPMNVLRDTVLSLEEKTIHLQNWLQEKYSNRQVRYYAEATFYFNE